MRPCRETTQARVRNGRISMFGKLLLQTKECEWIKTLPSQHENFSLYLFAEKRCHQMEFGIRKPTTHHETHDLSFALRFILPHRFQWLQEERGACSRTEANRSATCYLRAHNAGFRRKKQLPGSHLATRCWRARLPLPQHRAMARRT